MSFEGGHQIRPTKIIVCGVTFGQFYLEAISRLPTYFQLAGIFSRGGQRSRACALRHGVPLWTNLNDIPDDVEAACVVVRSGVMGGQGTELGCDLMKRGIHVLQEHPLHHDELVRCLRIANENRVRFQIGNLYLHLPSVSRFVEATRALLCQTKMMYIDASCSIQLVFSLLHVLSKALGNIRPWRFELLSSSGDLILQALAGSLAGIPLTFRIKNDVDPSNPDNGISLFHRIELGVEAGRLVLTDTHGAVEWMPALYLPETVMTSLDFHASDAAHLESSAITTLVSHAQSSFQKILSGSWPDAIGRDLLEFRDGIACNQVRDKTQQTLLTLCKVWKDLTLALGYPAIRPIRQLSSLDLDSIRAAISPDTLVSDSQ